MPRSVGTYLMAVAVAGYGGLQILGRRAGSTLGERTTPLPGDDLITRPNIVTNHAITIDAPPAAVWPWLTQLGWHLGGYYTPRWVDRLLFPDNWPSLDHLDPALLRDLTVGDIIPDGKPGTAFFVVARAEAPHTLVLHSTTHVPPRWRRSGAAVDWTWTFRLTARPAGSTRLHLRVRGRTCPRWLTTGYQAALVPADFVMAVGMLRGIKHRAESRSGLEISGREPFTPDPTAILRPQ
jgi:hypothetical protein